MFDYFEKVWEIEDLTEEEIAVLKAEWAKLENWQREEYEESAEEFGCRDGFESFADEYIHNLCYGED